MKHIGAMKLNGFKKMSGDEHHTVMQHDDGHQLKIHHAALSPKMRAQLLALPSKQTAQQEPLKMAKGGEAPKEDADIDLVARDRAIKEVEGEPGSTVAIPPPAEEPIYIPANAAELSSHMDAPTRMPGATPPPEPQAAPNPDSVMTPKPSPFAGAMMEAQNAIQSEASAKGDLGNQQAEMYENANRQLAAQGKLFQSQLQANIAHQDDIAHDIANNHVDPNRYMANLSTGDRISTAIGLVLGGMGGGVTGQGNPALQYLNNQIDRDIDAQKADLGKKQNLLSSAMHQFGNIRDAADFAKSVMNSKVLNDLNAAAAGAVNPIEQSRAQQAIAQYKMQNLMLAAKISANQTLDHSQAQPQDIDQALNTLRQVDPAGYKLRVEQYVPGIGMAKVPVVEKERSELTGRQDLQNQVDMLRAWAQKHTGSLSPTDINYGNALAAQVQDAYRRANGQGVFREAEANFVKGVVSDNPTAFLNKFTTDPKYAALQDMNRMSLNALKRSKGLPVSEPPTTAVVRR